MNEYIYCNKKDQRKAVEVCRKAIEVQRLWKPKVGDWFVTPAGKVELFDKSFYIKENFISDYDIIENELWERKKIYWLPRQDQLQDMVKSEYECDYDMNLDFTEFTTNLYTHEQIGASMEQLWLAFVMHELHSKQWDGKQWK